MQWLKMPWEKIVYNELEELEKKKQEKDGQFCPYNNQIEELEANMERSKTNDNKNLDTTASKSNHDSKSIKTPRSKQSVNNKSSKGYNFRSSNNVHNSKVKINYFSYFF